MFDNMSQEVTDETKYWLGFNLVSGIGPAKFRMLHDYFGSARGAWHANEAQLKRIGIDRSSIRNLIEAKQSTDLDAELAKTKAAGLDILTWQSPEYPLYLKEIPNPPPLLYLKGEIKRSDQWAVAVVGTRRMTPYGRQVTRDLVAGLARSNVTIVSGLARGIDAIGHLAALEAGGRTIAVLGSGLDQIYPPENQGLAESIQAGHGAIVSEYALGVRPEARNFPPRNRLISGLSLGVIVVEAGERSGALITANFAIEQDRDVFAVPGNVNSPASKGTNRIIQGGAKLVRTVDDILEELNLTMLPDKAAVQLAIPESAEEALLLSHLSHQPLHIDDLTRQAQLPSRMVSSTLTLMELKGMILQVGGMNYTLAREPGPTYDHNSSEE